jgi:hypothetical protein
VPSIDFAKLQGVVRDTTSSARNVKDSNRCYPEYNSLVSNYMTKHNTFKEKESALHIVSMQNWIQKKEVITSTITPDYGQIWLTDLGSNYKPECSYAHPTVVVEMVGNMVMIIPTTTSPQLLADAYHPIDNPTGNKFLRKVGAAEGFANPGVLLISNMRAISRGRLLDLKGVMTGVTDKSSVFWEIKNRAFEFTFPKKNIEIYNLNQANQQITEERDRLQQEKEELDQKNQDLERQLDDLKKKFGEVSIE